MPLDIYSTYAQLAAIELMPREGSFLWDLFVKDEGMSDEEKAIFDYRKGVVQMAPVVHENTGGFLMSRGGYETREIDFCTIAPERMIEAHQLKSRYFGERVLGAMTPAQREKKMLAQDHVDMIKAIQRRREWMARQILLTGKLEVFKYTDEGASKKATLMADFGFTQRFVPEVSWDQAGAKIEDNMKQITDMVYEGMGDVEIIVMHPSVERAMLNNSKYLEQHNILRMDTGKIESTYRGGGIRYLGKNADGKDMYSCSEKFIDDDGTVKSKIPEGTLIAGSRGMLKCLHGPVIQVEKEDGSPHQVYVKREVPLRHGSIKSNSIMNRITSRPTLMPYNVDSWVVAEVL